ncbi:MAG TPA: hypothetical protein VMT20_25765 [Terriglobia bacterium]|nr:hypothetical protein [Terriglobia bacterium]
MRDRKKQHGGYAQGAGKTLPVAGTGTNAADRMKSGAEVGGLTPSCFWPTRS